LSGWWNGCYIVARVWEEGGLVVEEKESEQEDGKRFYKLGVLKKEV
jgi:hypothetical protein